MATTRAKLYKQRSQTSGPILIQNGDSTDRTSDVTSSDVEKQFSASYNRPRSRIDSTLGRSLFVESYGDYSPINLTEFVRTRTRWAMFFILLAVLFNSCAFYTVIYCILPVTDSKPYGWSSSKTLNYLNIVYMIQYLLAFLTTALSDTYLERFNTIIVGYFISGLGYSLYVTTQEVYNNTCAIEQFFQNDSSSEAGHLCGPFVFTSLCLIAAGIGVFNGNILVFGADQVMKSETSMFFHLFYWMTKLGSLVACVGTNYLETKWASGDHHYADATAFGCIVMSFVCFFLGKSQYNFRGIQPDLVPTMWDILRSVVSHSNRRKLKDFRANLRATGSVNADQPTLFHFVTIEYGGQFRRDVVESVERLLRLSLVFFSFIPFYIFKIQFTSAFKIQGIQMRFPDWTANQASRNNMTLCTIKYPISWFSTGVDLVFLLILIPILFLLTSNSFTRCFRVIRRRLTTGDNFLEQRTRFYVKRDPIRLTIGLLCAALSMLLATFVDVGRKKAFDNCSINCTINQQFNGVVYPASKVSVLWQIPQYMLAAASEVLIIVTAYQYAYLESPDIEEEQYKMQGIFMGLCFLARLVASGITISIGSFLDRMTNNFCYTSFDEDTCTLKNETFYAYFSILAAIEIIGILLNKLAVRKYQKWTLGED